MFPAAGHAGGSSHSPSLRSHQCNIGTERRNHHWHRTQFYLLTCTPRQSHSRDLSHPNYTLCPMTTTTRHKSWDWSEITGGLCALHLCKTAQQKDCQRKRGAAASATENGQEQTAPCTPELTACSCASPKTPAMKNMDLL